MEDDIYVSKLSNCGDILSELGRRIDRMQQSGEYGFSDVVLIIDTNTAEWLMSVMGEGFRRNEVPELDPLDEEDHEEDRRIQELFRDKLDESI